jgi:hypothetical protein
LEPKEEGALMYIPKHWHWIGPVATVMLGFYIRQNFGGYWDVYLLVQLPLATLAMEWGAYIWQAGVLYQRYITNAPAPEKKPSDKLTDWHTGKPVEYGELQPIHREQIQDDKSYTQVVEFPKFSLERRFAIDVLRMYDFDPATQKHVDMTEKRWVIEKKMFAQKPFANMKLRWEHFGVIRRKTEHKNSKYLVAKREAVALIASGNSLPEWSPPLPN